MLEQEFKHLEDKIDTLLSAQQELRRKNHSLLNNEKSLMNERTELMKKNDLARNKIEAMISRLKGLEES
ncbi:MAG: TIGR02449 family protein [Pseudomonadales bacterium]|nr:TIGR02449 family protein [Pseudomonadales bacterium]